VGQSAFRTWQAAHPQDWLATKGKWEVEKREWDPEAAADSGGAARPPSYVPIPVSLYAHISLEDRAALRSVRRSSRSRAASTVPASHSVLAGIGRAALH
jgi:hypothetical protein